MFQHLEDQSDIVDVHVLFIFPMLLNERLLFDIIIHVVQLK